ncbi:hypothetical protein M3B46_07865 [Sphingobacterium daejeonense]|uniref:hypothetical protein n=1 Tax=Sphingobacterium daejeonense TaxID=371142 RepID=UPI0021A311D7|nr:hypothetical protein [Sphingobacterium daejeonense]MCT1530904.1 hypothetical protein [Sphingobacterium daejeonense]
MKYTFRSLPLLLSALIMVINSSCQKDSDFDFENSNLKMEFLSGESTNATTNFTAPNTKGYLTINSDGSYGARDFSQGSVPDEVDESQWKNPADTYYFKLSSNDGGTENDYDFKFSGTANANFTVNTAKYDLYYVNQELANVGSTNQSGRIKITNGTAGYNSLTGIGNRTNPGWYIYNLRTHIMTSFSPRTYILVSKSTGDSYKIKLRSVYKGETPNADRAANNFPFMSFDYKKF